MTKNEFDARVLSARSHVHALDAAGGFQERNLRTILFALKAGLMNPECDAQFDAYVMLEDIVNAKQETTR